jgi:putative ABC transport system permease protein
MRTFLAEFLEGVWIAGRAIRTNLMRSALTTLGIVVGIVAVTSMFTTINGIERGFERSMEMLGTNVLYVQKWAWFTSGDEWWEVRNRREVKEEIADAILRSARYPEAVAPVAQTARPVTYRDRTVSGIFIQASTPAYTKTNDIDLSAGRFYNDIDYHSGRRVAVIGAEVADGLFPTENPLGKDIRIGGHEFQVIGVMVRQGKFLGLFSIDSQVQMPLSAFRSLFGMSHRGLTIQVKIPNAELLGPAEDELISIIRVARGLDISEENDFAINRQDAFRQQFNTMKTVIYGIGLFLTALSLLVGGIGVMNIMFVSVKERTREIGIRKAVGAKPRAIMTQFLLEAVFVCVGGGVIGILISYGVATVINSFFTAVLSTATVILAFSICVGVGLVFGFIPARSAAKARPIEALHSD